MKKLLSLTLCVCLLCMLVVPVSASTGNAQLLEYDHIDIVTANLTLDRFWGIASCDGYIEATESNPVYVQVSLQKKHQMGGKHWKHGRTKGRQLWKQVVGLRLQGDISIEPTRRDLYMMEMATS